MNEYKKFPRRVDVSIQNMRLLFSFQSVAIGEWCHLLATVLIVADSFRLHFVPLLREPHQDEYG